MVKEAIRNRLRAKESENDREEIVNTFKEMSVEELFNTVSLTADYEEIQGFMVQLSDVYKKSGKKLFIKSHKALLKTNHFRKRKDKVKRGYTEGIVEYLGGKIETRITLMGKYLELNLNYFWEERKPTVEELIKDIEDTPYCFLRRRIILPRRCIIL